METAITQDHPTKEHGPCDMAASSVRQPAGKCCGGPLASGLHSAGAVGEINTEGGEGREISLTRGLVAIVDFDDYERCAQHRWSARTDHNWTNYAQRWCGEKKGSQSMHQFVMGKAPHGMEIDHIDHNGLNNRKNNLRFVTHRQNKQNKKTGSSAYPGVSWHKRDKRWQAHIRIDGKFTHLGTYLLEVDAFNAYRTKIQSLGLSVIMPRGL